MLPIKKCPLINTNYLYPVSAVYLFFSYMPMTRSIYCCILIHTMADLASLANINWPILSFSSLWMQRAANSQSDLLGVQDLQRKAQRTESISPNFCPLKHPINGSLLVENQLTKVSTMSTHAEFDSQLEQQCLGCLDICTPQSLWKKKRFITQDLWGTQTQNFPSPWVWTWQLYTSFAVVISRRHRETANTSDGIRERFSNPVRQGPHPSRVFSPTRETNAFTKETGLPGEIDCPLLVGQKTT